MKEKKPSRQTKFGVIASLALVGIMCWFKRVRKRNTLVDKQEKASGDLNNAKSWWGIFANVVFFLVTLIIIIGAVLYIVASYQIPLQTPDSQSNTGTGFQIFDLAIASGLLGGFALIMVVARRGPKHLQASLLLQGVFYVLATAAFIVFGFYLAADKARLLESLTGLVPVYVISFYVGSISLAIGVFFTLWSLIRLLIKNWKHFGNLVKQAISGD